MTTQELAELFLTKLYDLAEAAPHPNFLFNMNEFVPAVGITDFAELARAIELLESRGFVYMTSFDPMGGISAGISPDGSEFVEKGGETGIIAEFRKNPLSFYKGPSNVGPMIPPMDHPIIKDMGPEWMLQQSQIEEKPGVTEVPAGLPRSQGGTDSALDGLLLAVSILIEKDTTLTKADRDDLLKDMEALKIQVRRNTLNKEAVVALLDSLSSLESLVPLLKHIAQSL
jgi:hypothetical protein